MGEGNQDHSEGMVQLRFDTGPEVIMSSAFKKANLDGWRTQFAVEGVTPTFVWPKKKVALFADDCRRHRCPKHSKEQASKKDQKGALQDELESRKLRETGWKVVHTYECEISTPEGALGVANFIESCAIKVRE